MPWKVGQKWTAQRRIKQGHYYWRVGKKHNAFKQWGKAGAIIKKEKGVYWTVEFDLRDEYETP